jgi:hypothetical protein
MTNPNTIKVLHIDDDGDFQEMFRNTYGDQFEIVPSTEAMTFPR